MRKRLYEFVAVSFPLLVIVSILLGVSISSVYAQDEPETKALALGSAATEDVVKAELASSETRIIVIAIAVMISAAMLSASYAVGKVGSAALGAASEKPELFGRSILFVGLAEGIAIWGFVVSVLLYTKI
jgi:V/A-type H+-transporting ATPase subunit K